MYPNIPENYGVEIGETFQLVSLAFSLLAYWNKKLSESLTINIRYQMFANYETIDFETIDHRLALAFIAKVPNIINLSLTSLTIYDIDQDSKI